MNEIVIMLALYCTMCFSPMIDDISTKFRLGYVSCIIVGTHLLTNLFFITSNTIKLVILNFRVMFAKSHMNKSRIENFRSRAKSRVLRRRRNKKRARQNIVDDYRVEVDVRIELLSLEALRRELNRIIPVAEPESELKS